MKTQYPSSKVCFKCERRMAREKFYRHAMMTDGLLGKCKDCTRADVKANYRLKIDYYHAYERNRSQTSERKTALAESLRRHRRRHPERNRARAIANRAMRSGKLELLPCEVCGDCKSQAHHPDYSRPLEIKWLCFYHHRSEEGRLVEWPSR